MSLGYTPQNSVALVAIQSFLKLKIFKYHLLETKTNYLRRGGINYFDIGIGKIKRDSRGNRYDRGGTFIKY